MVEFSAGAVMTMLGLVEATVITLYLRLAGKKADESDVEDLEEDVEDVEEKWRVLERDVAEVDRRLDDVVTDGGRENS